MPVSTNSENKCSFIETAQSPLKSSLWHLDFPSSTSGHCFSFWHDQMFQPHFWLKWWWKKKLFKELPILLTCWIPISTSIFITGSSGSLFIIVPSANNGAFLYSPSRFSSSISSCILAFGRISNTALNTERNNEYPCFAYDFGGKSPHICPWGYFHCMYTDVF